MPNQIQHKCVWSTSGGHQLQLNTYTDGRMSLSIDHGPEQMATITIGESADYRTIAYVNEHLVTGPEALWIAAQAESDV